MRRILPTAATALIFLAFAACAGDEIASVNKDEYITVDKDGNMTVSGPFNAVIPKPERGRTAGPVHTTPSFLDEHLKVSLAGYLRTTSLSPCRSKPPMQARTEQ
jgi:hypothetical protein